MNRKRFAAATMAAVLLALPVGAAAAATSPVIPPKLAPLTPSVRQTVSVEGTLEYVTDLETPHYVVGGWALLDVSPSVLSKLAGKSVTVTGTPFTGMSILMRNQLVVSGMEATLEGELVWVTDLETPHFELDGWVVEGDAAKLTALAGQPVKLSGQVALTPSIHMKPVFQVAEAASGEQVGALLSAAGVVRYESQLESPHYVLNGWVLQLEDEALLAQLVGKQVVARGTEFTGMSILMRPQLIVSELEVLLEGTLTLVTDLEAPHYQVDGFVVSGEAATLQSLNGKPVFLRGAVNLGPSIYMKPVVETITLSSAEPRLPVSVAVAGTKPTFPTVARMQDGTLMLPLRAMVETAGGRVTWDQANWAVRVELGTQSTLIRIGATLHSTGQLKVAPALESGHTLVPLEFFGALGLKHRWEGDHLIFALPEVPSSDQPADR